MANLEELTPGMGRESKSQVMHTKRGEGSHFTGLDAFDKAIHKANIWIKEITEENKELSRERAYLCLRATLQALRDCLETREACDFGAQLPTLIRGFYFDGFKGAGKQAFPKSSEDFQTLVRRNIGLRENFELSVPDAITAVFRVISRHVTSGEIKDVVSQLPKELKEYWSAQTVGDA